MNDLFWKAQRHRGTVAQRTTEVCFRICAKLELQSAHVRSLQMLLLCALVPLCLCASAFSGGPGEWEFHDYVVRRQTRGHVDIDIRGEHATADASHTLWLDTATVRWMAHSKPYIHLTAARAVVPAQRGDEAASQHKGAPQSSTPIYLERASAVLYLGGRFESDSLAVDVDGGGMEARGEVWFERKPLMWRAQTVRAAAGFETIQGESLSLKCGASSASGASFTFDLETRRLDLSGGAIYKSGQRVIRRDRLSLKFNSPFTELTPVGE